MIGLTVNAVFGKGPFSWGVGFTYIAYDTALLLFVSFQMLKVLKATKRQKSDPVDTLFRRPTLAVLITARNEASVLKLCLQALQCQSELPDLIFWIDDGSTDQTKSLLQAFLDDKSLNIIHIMKAHSGKADSLNQVWPTVEAEVIVTLDADTILEKNAIREIRTAFAQNENLAATGGLLTPTSWSREGSLFETFQRFEYIRSFLARRAWMTKNALLLVSGAFAAYRKKVLTEVGGYDPQSLVEDYDLTHRIHRYSYEHGLHYEVQVTVSALATTDVPVTVRQFLRQRTRWFQGFLQTQFKNTDMVGNKKYGNVGRFMLMIKSADTLQPIYGLLTLATLFYFIVAKKPIDSLIWQALLAKIMIDLIFHYASVAIYFRWRGERATATTWALSTMATFLEPISFQVLRHTGALLGWISFLGRKHEWTPSRGNSKLK